MMILNLFSPNCGINSFIPIFGTQLSNKSKFLGLIYLIAFCFCLSVEANSQWAKIRVMRACLGEETE